MKTYIRLSLLFCLSLRAFAQNDIPPAPNPPRLVNDLANVLQPADRETLERKLRAYNDSTSTQFAIVLVRTYGIYDRADYTFRLANKWGIGQKGKNNGLLLTVAIDDRKYFIATGYGLEGSIPDALARRVGEQYLKPNFRENNYYKGLDEATSYLARLPAGEFKAAPRQGSDSEGNGFMVWVVVGLVFLFIILPLIRRGGGGGRGGYRGGGYVPPFVIFGSGGSSSGWGGGGGGGGFGGFGGGSFGGGGAGGDW